MINLTMQVPEEETPEVETPEVEIYEEPDDVSKELEDEPIKEL